MPSLAFLLGITGNLAFAAGNVALSLNRHMQNGDFDIVIYHRGLNETDRRVRGEIPRVGLRPFDFPDTFTSVLLERLPAASRFRDWNSLMCFCHFEAFSLLKEYSHVVWLDADIAIQGDIAAITQFAPFGLTPDTPWTVSENFTHLIDDYRMELPGYCTAIMALSDRLPHQELHSWCYEKALNYAHLLKNPDQAIINLALQEFSITVQTMRCAEWQCVPWRDEALAAKIVHFATDRKVWRDADLCVAFPEWYRTHLTWLELGGGDFDRRHLRLSNGLARIEWANRIGATGTAPIG